MKNKSSKNYVAALMLFCITFWGYAQDPGQKIVGGYDVDISKHPHQVFLNVGCGGSILSPTWILTAAHCTEDENASGITVRAGVTRQSESGGQTVRVKRIVTISDSNNADMSLLELANPLDLSGPNAKAIPYAGNIIPLGSSCIGTGWGDTSFMGNSPDNLKAVEMFFTGYQDNSEQFLTITGNGKSACQGDSGGPLVTGNDPANNLLIGVVSHGYKCDSPSFYGNIVKFASQIQSITGISPNSTGTPTPTPTPIPTPPPGGSCDLPKALDNLSVNNETVNYNSGVIDISCVSSASIFMNIQGVGSMENSDYLNVYYKVNGGSEIVISENQNAFASKTISATGIKGSSVEVIIKGFTSFGDETYTVSNITVSGSGVVNPTPDPIPIPGGTTLVIQAEDFSNTGGAFDGFQTYTIGGVTATNFNQTGDWAEYTVNIAQSGSYSMEYFISTPLSGPAIEFILDGVSQMKDIVPNSGSWDSFESLKASQNITLSKGTHVIRLLGAGTNGWEWNLDRFVLKSASTGFTGYSALSDAEDFTIFPNPATAWIIVSTVEPLQLLEVFDLSGKSVLKVKNSQEINVSALKSGPYILIMNAEKRKIFVKK